MSSTPTHGIQDGGMGRSVHNPYSEWHNNMHLPWNIILVYIRVLMPGYPDILLLQVVSF